MTAGTSTLSVLSTLSQAEAAPLLGAPGLTVTAKLAGWSHATVTPLPSTPSHLPPGGGSGGGGAGDGTIPGRGAPPASRASVDRLWRTADGALPWTAPEALRGERVGPPADIYAFGVLLWGLLTGVADPYAPEGLSPLVAAAEVAEGGGRRRPRLPRGGGGGWAALAERCWAEVPESRPRAEEVATALARLRCDLVGGAEGATGGGSAATTATTAGTTGANADGGGGDACGTTWGRVSGLWEMLRGGSRRVSALGGGGGTRGPGVERQG
ncbi:hypothetical protein MMPV_001758 [Pyropia vietnamensis]